MAVCSDIEIKYKKTANTNAKAGEYYAAGV